MNSAVMLRPYPVALPAKVSLSGLLSLFKKLQQLAEPLATADGLRKAVELLVELGSAAGLSPAWISRLQSLLNDTGSFDTALSIVAYLESAFGSSSSSNVASNSDRRDEPAAAIPELAIDAQSLADWLPLVIQILQMIQSIRG